MRRRCIHRPHRTRAAVGESGGDDGEPGYGVVVESGIHGAEEQGAWGFRTKGEAEGEDVGVEKTAGFQLGENAGGPGSWGWWSEAEDAVVAIFDAPDDGAHGLGPLFEEEGGEIEGGEVQRVKG